ncbi:MAG: ATP-binding protein, partial [Synergistaceae bacterium]|nr:ATP-binding protein [Synergistaceae bacterium]
MDENRSTYEFQSEAKQVLDLMIHSVYSNPDIFLRELVSNASDALDKLRLESLSDEKLADAAKDGRITVSVDKERKTVTVSDNGIGMTKDELVSYLGTIARSGTKEFIASLREAGGGDLIGQFGVGFYSSFIAADRVTVKTRRAGSDEAWLWDSAGGGSFTIEPSDRDGWGSDVILRIKDREPEDDASAGRDYLSVWTLREI